MAIINGFYAQRRAYFTLAIDSPHHGLSNELLYVAIGHFKVILSQNWVYWGPVTGQLALNNNIGLREIQALGPKPMSNPPKDAPTKAQGNITILA